MRAIDRDYSDGEFVVVDDSILEAFAEHGMEVPHWLFKGMVGEVIPVRISAEHINPCVVWNEIDKITNLDFLGLSYGGETYRPIGIMECPLEYLSEKEKVMRGLLEDGMPSDHVETTMAVISQAMNKYGIVFYQP